ncbi:ribonuclease Rpp14/Pop5 family protein [Phanerochaete sordida]|uniref:Ribonuclease P/MRP protein subunit POP5 n=1 Tax=Phanerochaete sordida TaxID=48140 RepID=A0A9P3G0T6_9APHY|nr:ribonuclease Rpp14/Pop5 family protein [Phanerochaete sordida]
MVRFKNRWLLVELIPCPTATASALDASSPEDNGINSKQIWSALKQSVLNNFGDTGWGAVSSSLTIKYYSPTTNVCIIRVARDHHKTAWAGVTMLTNIEGRKYIPNVVHVSGTIKQAQLSAITHNREVIARYRANRLTAAAYQDSYEEFLQKSTQELEALQD